MIGRKKQPRGRSSATNTITARRGASRSARTAVSAMAESVTRAGSLTLGRTNRTQVNAGRVLAIFMLVGCEGLNLLDGFTVAPGDKHGMAAPARPRATARDNAKGPSVVALPLPAADAVSLADWCSSIPLHLHPAAGLPLPVVLPAPCHALA
jgi:hypothetical protein